MSLGLKKADFKLLLANELSPMAAETFAYNLLEENLVELPVNGHKHDSVLWLNSRHSEFKLRLRENPQEFPPLDELHYSDIPADPTDLEGKLVVGNIIQLNQLLKARDDVLQSIKNGFNGEGVDLVSGGPPCQSFSLAGLRRRDCEKNTLPWEFANFVEMVRAKFVILENVTGILRAFRQNGESFHAWFEVAKAFAEKGYVPLCLHINVRKIGVPQNRPRFIMLGVRDDIYTLLKESFSDVEKVLFSPGETLYQNLVAGKNVEFSEYRYFDVHKDNDIPLFEESFLKHLVGEIEVTAHQAIGDLQAEKDGRKPRKSSYVMKLNETFDFLPKVQPLANHDLRKHGLHVKRRFRIYQLIQELQKSSKSTAVELTNILKHKSDDMSDEAWGVLINAEFLRDEKSFVSFDDKGELLAYLQSHPTKKRSQKALDKDAPAPAALSIPDDVCHYNKDQLRTLSVREIARFQSFPDNFVFKAKVTTGGKMRSYEVPQYTQVGNAVPPLLGLALGNIVKELISRLDS